MVPKRCIELNDNPLLSPLSQGCCLNFAESTPLDFLK